MAAMKSLVMIGNPGCGKSSTINCLLQTPLFTSGISTTGRGVTETLDVKEHLGTLYMDTPGLSDMVLRKAAAKAIYDALSRGGDFQIIFVLQLIDGRIQPDDLLTMKLVLDAANQIPPDGYAIMINKIGETVLSRLHKPSYISIIHEDLAARGAPTTKHIHFAPKIKALEEASNVLADLSQETLDFLRKAPRLLIDGAKVQAVNADSFDEMKQAIAEEQALRKESEEARRLAELHEKEAKEQQMLERAAREQAEEARQEAHRQAVLQQTLCEDAEKRARAAEAQKVSAERAAQLERDQGVAERNRISKEREALAERVKEVEAAKKRAEALANETVSMNKAAEREQTRLREQNEKLQQDLDARTKAAEEEAKSVAARVQEGDLVFIKSSIGHYIADKVLGNGYVGISKSGQEAAKFKVHYDRIYCPKSHGNAGIRLEHKGERFARQFRDGERYMYASTGGKRYCCYDGAALNTKQLWQPELAKDRTVLFKGTLKYDTEIILRDCYVFSVMCQCECQHDANYDYLCSQYENEKDYLDVDKPGHCKTWFLERAV